ncbi:MAG TPA: biotin/lipoyl-containing protein, partial [Jatrophihabitans sp.]|nr:biotin/lipoyl-containing protein [Jatrophihabitans sp.]
MPVSVTMPRLGESVTEGTVTRWLKQEGDQVAADEPLLEVSTDKVDTEVPSPASGILTSIKVAEDETVEIGVELAVISEAGSEPAADSAPAAQQESEPEPEPAQPVAEEEPEPEPEPEPAQPVAEEEQPEPEPEPAQPVAEEEQPEP